MFTKDVSKFLVHDDDTVRHVLDRINACGHRTAFVISSDNVLSGTVTDGDLRRFLISGGELDDSISNIINHSPITIDEESAENHEFSWRKYSYIDAIPVINIQKRPVGAILRYELLKPQNINALQNVEVVIMAGGKGERLYPYTAVLPKPLIPVGDVPVIERILSRFSAFGVRKYTIIVNHMKNLIRAYLSELDNSYDISFVEEPEPLGTAGGLGFLNGCLNAPFFVTNCDVLVNADLEAAYKSHIDNNNDFTIITAKQRHTIPYGVVNINENCVCGIQEKPSIAHHIITGIYILSPDILPLVPQNVETPMNSLIESLIKRDGRIGYFAVEEQDYLDMGNFDGLNKMKREIGWL